MEKFKMSQFVGNKKTMRYINGRLANGMLRPINGEIEFNDLNEELINKIMNGLSNEVKKKTNGEKITYDLLPYLTNIEMDITFDEFKELEVNSLFIEFMAGINKTISTIVKTMFDNIKAQESMIKELSSTMSKDNKRIVLTKDEDKIVTDLLKEINGADDKKKKEIIHKISNISDKK